MAASVSTEKHFLNARDSLAWGGTRSNCRGGQLCLVLLTHTGPGIEPCEVRNPQLFLCLFLPQRGQPTIISITRNEAYTVGSTLYSTGPTYVPTVKYFLVVKALWHFSHSFLSSILRSVFGFISEFQLFFEKLEFYRVRNRKLFCDQFSFIVPTFNYLQVVMTQ